MKDCSHNKRVNTFALVGSYQVSEGPQTWAEFANGSLCDSLQWCGNCGSIRLRSAGCWSRWLAVSDVEANPGSTPETRAQAKQLLKLLDEAEAEED